MCVRQNQGRALAALETSVGARRKEKGLLHSNKCLFLQEELVYLGFLIFQ
jgi:hypothetical protein